MFLLPLLVGFAFNLASAFTTFLCRTLGERGGRTATFILRNVVGIPVWSAGLALAVRAPSALAGATSTATELLGWLLLAGGSVIMLWALFALRTRAALPSIRDPLIAHGPYALVRHPIYAGLLLTFAALVLLRPTRAALLATLIAVAWVNLQARCEEIDLLQRLPSYRPYMRTTPRFVPRIRRVGV
jgi:protein-S-isoprenylcysteine O-methyltransferase Ste14